MQNPGGGIVSLFVGHILKNDHLAHRYALNPFTFGSMRPLGLPRAAKKALPPEPGVRGAVVVQEGVVSCTLLDRVFSPTYTSVNVILIWAFTNERAIQNYQHFSDYLRYYSLHKRLGSIRCWEIAITPTIPLKCLNLMCLCYHISNFSCNFSTLLLSFLYYFWFGGIFVLWWYLYWYLRYIFSLLHEYTSFSVSL